MFLLFGVRQHRVLIIIQIKLHRPATETATERLYYDTQHREGRLHIKRRLTLIVQKELSSNKSL